MAAWQQIINQVESASDCIRTGSQDADIPIRTLLEVGKILTHVITDVDQLINQDSEFQIPELSENERIDDLLNRLPRSEGNEHEKSTADSTELSTSVKTEEPAIYDNNYPRGSGDKTNPEVVDEMDVDEEVSGAPPPKTSFGLNKGRGRRGRPTLASASLASKVAGKNPPAQAQAQAASPASFASNSLPESPNKVTVATAALTETNTNKATTPTTNSKSLPSTTSVSTSKPINTIPISTDPTKKYNYGYEAPPSLSSYNGKIGRSFYTSAYNPSTPILPNSQVAYNQGGAGEWILCRVLRVSSETRFAIQDPEPDEQHPNGQIFRANHKEVILVPLHNGNNKLKPYKPGSRVLAKYPETTTFYPAEVTHSTAQHCTLRFEGEEDADKQTTVDRVFVLPFPTQLQ